MEELIAELGRIDFTEIEIEELLENRDSETFDNEWVRVYEEIEDLKKVRPYSENDEKYNSDIRENVFKVVYELSGDSELAGSVSDDFGLIADSGILKYTDVWLDQLIDNYKNRKIPGGSL